jgi:hypothetical protein
MKNNNYLKKNSLKQTLKKLKITGKNSQINLDKKLKIQTIKIIKIEIRYI